MFKQRQTPTHLCVHAEVWVDGSETESVRYLKRSCDRAFKSRSSLFQSPSARLPRERPTHIPCIICICMRRMCGDSLKVW